MVVWWKSQANARNIVKSLTILNLQHAASRIWTGEEPELNCQPKSKIEWFKKIILHIWKIWLSDRVRNKLIEVACFWPYGYQKLLGKLLKTWNAQT